MSVIVMGMVVLLIANLTYVQVVEGPSLRDDPRNPRLRLAETTSPRGEILAGDQVLASSAPTPGSPSYTRSYPGGPAFAPVTGYLSAAYGLTGMEQAESSVLDGSDPRLLLDHVRSLASGEAPQPGNVVTTIDPRVQQVAYQDMVSRGYVGAVVAIRPSTGAILAMVSTPSFDPNAFGGTNAAAAWTAASSANPQVLSDRATSQLYPPGSTFKLVDLGAALQDGVTPDTPVTAASQITLPDTSTTLENYDGEHCGPEGTDTVPLSEALARSCNTAFATLADQVGADRLRDQAEAFGFDSPDLSIPFPVVASGLGALSDQASLAQSGIGQRDVRVTPMQNAEIVAAIANGGVRMAPYLVQQILGSDRSVVDTPDPTSLGRALPESVAATITQMMIGSEQLTTGHGDGPPGVTIASKTGTAEHGVDSKTTPPHTWYSAFAPAQQPDVAVTVLVENGGRLGDDATGGSVASPIGRDVIAAALADAR